MVKDFNKLKFSLAMTVFGTIGLFVRLIPFPSAVISMCRGFFGAVFLALFIVFAKKPFSIESIKANIINLLISGALLGFNWILLFESYKYTTVAKATLCYYMAPVMVILISPFVFKEKITLKKGICIIVSLIGMLFVSGVFEEKTGNKNETVGILLSLLSAVIYTVIIVLNKKLKSIGAFERTVMQLFVCGAVMLIYSSFTGDILKPEFTALGIILMAVVCIVHTGIAYLIYFGTMEKLNAQSIAILSYIDPVVAVVLSSFIEKPMTGYGVIGAVLIIVASAIS